MDDPGSLSGICNSPIPLLGPLDNMRISFAIFIRETATVFNAVSYTHLRAHETVLDLVCRLLLEKKKKYNTTADIHD